MAGVEDGGKHLPKLRTTNCERGKVVRSFYESLAKTFAILVVLLLDGLVEIWSYLAKTPSDEAHNQRWMCDVPVNNIRCH